MNVVVRGSVKRERPVYIARLRAHRLAVHEAVIHLPQKVDIGAVWPIRIVDACAEGVAARAELRIGAVDRKTADHVDLELVVEAHGKECAVDAAEHASRAAILAADSGEIGA